MKIGELVKQTQVSKETIHYYVREGILPRPRKLGKNVAEYNESYVDRIRLIKEFQDHCFLPLSVIKRVLKFEKGSPEREWFLQLHTDYFRPVDKLLPTEIVGEKQFRQATGLGRRWLAKMEEWRIITPEIRNGQKAYSQDDLTLGKVVVDMDKFGLGPEDGFDPEALKVYGEYSGLPDNIVQRVLKLIPKEALQTDEVKGIDSVMADAVSQKFLSAPLTPEQLKQLIQIQK